MVNVISKLSDTELLTRTQRLAAEERKLTLDILMHLKEIEFRRLYSARGFSSIFDYAVKELLYSEAAASRRIAAMRLLKSIPEVADSIENGSLSLSTVISVQSFLKREEREQGKTYSLNEKKDLLQSLENKSKRECEKVLLELSPTSVIPADRIKSITATETELRVVVKDETLKKMERLRELLSHRNPEGSLGNLLEIMAEIVLEKVDPERISERAELRVQRKSKEGVTSISPPAGNHDQASHDQANREPIPAPLKRQILKRDRYCCTYIDPLTGRQCGSKYLLETDHVIPVAHGGQTELTNLRTLCKSHNLFEAIRKLGRKTMEPHINRCVITRT